LAADSDKCWPVLGFRFDRIGWNRGASYGNSGHLKDRKIAVPRLSDERFTVGGSLYGNAVPYVDEGDGKPLDEGEAKCHCQFCAETSTSLSSSGLVLFAGPVLWTA